MVYVQLLCVTGIVTTLPCMGYLAPGQPAGGVVWTVFASPSILQQFYSTPLTVFGSSSNYPGAHYEMWGLAGLPSVWDAAPTHRKSRIKPSTPQQETSTGKLDRSKRFSPYFYGGVPGMTMASYGTGTASASAMAVSSYGSYGYPFFA